MKITEENGQLLLALWGAVRQATQDGAICDAAALLYEHGEEESAQLLQAIADTSVAIIDHELGFNSTEAILKGAPIHKKDNV